MSDTSNLGGCAGPLVSPGASGGGGGGAGSDIILDPNGIASGNIYTDYVAAITAAIALGAANGECRVHVMADFVDLSAGTIPAGMGRVRLVGKNTSETTSDPAGLPPAIVFAGSLQHTDWPRSCQNLALIGGGTAVPFPHTVAGKHVRMELLGCLVANGGTAEHVFDLAAVIQAEVYASGCLIGFDIGDPAIGVMVSGAVLNLDADFIYQGPLFDLIQASILAKTGPINADAFETVAGSTLFCMDTGAPRQFAGPLTGVVGALARQAFPDAGTAPVESVSGVATISSVNTPVGFSGTPGAYTLTLDFVQYTGALTIGNWMRFEGSAAMKANPVTLELTTGLFEGGGTTRVLDVDDGVWTMTLSTIGRWELNLVKSPLGDASIMTFGGGDVQGSGTADRFPEPWHDSGFVPTVEAFIDAPFDLVVDQMRADWDPAAASVNVDFDFRVEAVDTALDFTALSDAGSAENLSDEVEVDKGERMSCLILKSAGTTTAMGDMRISMRVRERKG